MLIAEVLAQLIIAILAGFIIAVPVIGLLYQFKITRRGEADFSNLIEKRKMKIGVPVMGGLIIVLTVLLLSFFYAPSSRVTVLMLIFAISALLGGLDDLLNIFGVKRRVRSLDKINTLIRVHAKLRVRLWYIITYPWHLYSRFFFMLGSNPGKGIHAHEKIIVQLVVGAILAVWLLQNDPDFVNVWLPVVGYIHLGILFIPFVILATILTTNAVNIADGLDGLSTTQLLSAFAGFGVIAWQQQQTDLVSVVIITVGAMLAYLYFNIPPARVQMGDVGSLALGTLLAALAFMLNTPMLLLIIGLPFVLTLLSTIIQGIGRRILGRRIFRMAPLHHHFELLGWSEEKVVMRFALFAAICAIVGLWIYFTAYPQTQIVIAPTYIPYQSLLGN